MVSRRPLIVNSAANQIQELTDSDDLSLPNSSITASIFIGNGTVPAGAVFHFAASTAPVGYLKANGDTIPNGSGQCCSLNVVEK